jgi:hypothetical protein
MTVRGGSGDATSTCAPAPKRLPVITLGDDAGA